MRGTLFSAIAAFIALSSCAVKVSAYVDTAALRNEIGAVSRILSQARSGEGPLCAPEALAQAEKYLAQASLEFDEGDYWESHDYIELARTVTEELIKELPGCRKDLDQDRIPDSKDRCREDPENYNGYLDDDGCVDIPPKRAVLTPGKIELLEPIAFDPRTHDVIPDSESVLHDVVQILRDNSTMRILIQGHWSDDLPSEEAQRVTLKEATSVKQALVSRGISAERIEVQGKGGSEPIASNSTELGRLINQRIELLTIPPR